MNLPQLRVDLANHFVYGSAIFAVAYTAAPSFGLPALLSGLAAVTAFALAKDVIYDKVMGKGTFDPLDIVATIAGAAPAALVAFIASGGVAPW